MLTEAIISCAEGDWIAIAKYLVKDTRLRLRKFVLGEVEMCRFHATENGYAVVHVLHLSQTRWHKFVRLLLQRANFYRKWIEFHRGQAELLPNVILDLDKKSVS